MEKRERKGRWFLVLLATIGVMLGILPAAREAGADTYYWDGDSGNWNVEANWDADAVPGAGDSAVISPGNSVMVTYLNDSNPLLDSVTVFGGSTLSQAQNSLKTDFFSLGDVGSPGYYSLSGSGVLTVNEHASIDWGSKFTIADGGKLTIVGNEIKIGASGTGYFEQNGGKAIFTGAMYLGDQSTAYGEYDMTGGSLTGGGLVLGEWGGAGVFNQGGGKVTVDELILARQNTESDQVTPDISEGTYNLSGDGKLTVNGDETIGYRGVGVFTQKGNSTHVVTGSLTVGYETGSSGLYNLEDGNLVVVGDEYIGRNEGSYGELNQSGGQHAIIGSLYIDAAVASKGNYYLSGEESILSVGSNLYVGREGAGVFTQTGGSNTVGGAMIIKSGAGSGTYDLQGGVLTVAGGITNNDVFNYSGGTLDADITNNAGGTVTLSGEGTRIVNGSVINDGTFKVTDTTAEYTGSFTNNGRYESDPSTNIFKDDLTVGIAGYIVGGSGDVFVMNADFINNSTRSSDWDTSLSTLLFDDGVTGTATNHTFALAGEDLGSDGYNNNFAWGALEIGDDDTLTLTDGNTGTVGAALYVTTILGLDLGVDGITNLFADEGITIYYLASALGNDYLNGQTYALAGGGSLMAAVPIPGSAMLMISGLMTLLGIKRYRGR